MNRLILSNKKMISKDAFICNGKILFNTQQILPGLHLSIYSDIKIGNNFISKRYTPYEYYSNDDFKLLL